MKLYKILTDGKSCNGGKLKWPLPRGKRPGAWVEAAGNVRLCNNGIHVVDAAHVLDWVGNEVWEIEVAGVGVSDGAKWVYPRARLLRLSMGDLALRHFAIACAARVLPIYEAMYPGDDRVRAALMPGARDAAWASARDAARDAARAAARAAARDAARAAARAAARDAAWDAARDAERAWQVRTLRRYLAGKVDLTKPVKLPPKPKVKR